MSDTASLTCRLRGGLVPERLGDGRGLGVEAARVALVEVVEKPREGADLFLEDEDALGTENLGDLALGIEHVAELAGSRGAGLKARGEATGARAMKTEMALLHHALGPGAVGQVAHIRVQPVGRHRRVREVEPPGPVRARGFAVTAADAPVVVDDG